ncbi:MAG: VIT and VWA domain-containing protein [Azoarcus sp.]|jgi:Ca-activated chloride channel family protein|nr:VIT and VWA domain-containing protein [Azoarcus sp.]
MVRDALALLAQQIGERLAAEPAPAVAASPLPEMPGTLKKCLSAGCYVTSSCFMALAVLFAPSSQARPADAPDGADRVASPYFYLPDSDAALDALPLKSTDVEVRIAGVIAEVKVTQVYKNEGARPIEAKYVFPGSTRAAVHALEVRLADRLIEARIREKARAKQEYEQAKSAGNTAALLEQHRPNVFQMNVANIMPGDEVRVALHYTESLRAEDGRYRFVFPAVVGPRYAPPRPGPDGNGWAAQPTLPATVDSAARFDIRLRLDTPISIKDIASSSHGIELRRPDGRRAEIDLAASARQAAGNRDFILDYRLAGDAVESGVMLMRGRDGAENFFLAMVEPPRAAPARVIVPRDYTFVLDTSGSMHGFALDTAKTLLRELIGGLRPGDTFNVLLFAGSSEFLRAQSVPATKENIERALQLIDRRAGGGGTELIPALRRVYAQEKPADVSRSIVVITDGYVTVESEAFKLVRDNLGQANLFAFGIGASVNRLLIEGLARAGMGEPFVITDPEEAPAQAARFRRMIASPVLTSVRANFEGVETWDVVPQAVPDVLAERPVVLFGKWRDGKGEGPKQLVVEGRRADGDYRQALPLLEALGENTERFAALRRLWARQRIADLSDQENLMGDGAQREAITALGLEYSLLTQYTSFVAVDEHLRNPHPASTPTIEQPLPMPRGVSNLAVSGTYVPGTPEPKTMGALLVTLSMLAMVARRLSRQRRRHFTL